MHVVRVPISYSTTVDQLIGCNTLCDGNIVYNHGILLTAMRDRFWCYSG